MSGENAAFRVKICMECQYRAGADEVYCPECGMLLGAYEVRGAEIMTLPNMNMYEGGETALGIAKAAGDLKIFDDRIEFERGSVLDGTFKSLGITRSPAAAKPEQTVYLMKDVISVRVGKNMGFVPALVLSVRPSISVSFSNTAVSESSIAEAVGKIEEYRLCASQQ